MTVFKTIVLTQIIKANISEVNYSNITKKREELCILCLKLFIPHVKCYNLKKQI